MGRFASARLLADPSRRITFVLLRAANSPPPCSPPRLTATQLGLDTRPVASAWMGTCTPLMWCAVGRTRAGRWPAGAMVK